MKYNPNYKHSQKQTQKSERMEYPNSRNRKRQLEKYFKEEYDFVSNKISDSFWWDSLINSEKCKVIDSYIFCKKNFRSGGLWYSNNDELILEDVVNEFDSWENKMKESIGVNESKVKELKLKSLMNNLS